MCKIEQIVRRRCYIITDMDIGDMDLRETRPEAAHLRLRVLRAHLMSIAEADRGYWSEKCTAGRTLPNIREDRNG